MKRICLLINLWLLVSATVMAQAVSREAAAQKAQAFMMKKGRTVLVNNPITTPVKSRRTHRGPAGDEPFYVFNASDNQGFVIISGDERTDAVLGYADSGSFDVNDMPENMRVWLQAYADQLASLPTASDSLCVDQLAIETHPAIAPLLTTRWNQIAPYNNSCPVINGKFCPTGCTATAMAQVMYYHRWPQTACESIPSYVDSNGHEFGALPPTTFMWNQMKDEYDTDNSPAARHAVADLMRYCGYASQMDYTPNGSGAYIQNAVYALCHYFDYDCEAHYEDRTAFTARGWDELIYGELAQQRPVIYDGYTTSSGHSFICDGYDGNGFYHINWGWGGHFNGYFKLSILNPNGCGIGGSAISNGYVQYQGALIGVQRPTMNAESYDHNSLLVTDFWVNDNTMSLEFWNFALYEANYTYGFAIQRDGESELTPVSTKTDFFDKEAASIIDLDVSSLDLADGTYRFYPFSHVAGVSQWTVFGEGTIYFECQVSGGTYRLITHPQNDFSVGAPEIKGNRIDGLPQDILFPLTNNGDAGLFDFYLFASKVTDPTVNDRVGSTTIYLEQGATEMIPLLFTPQSTGTWHLWLGTDSEGTQIYGPFDIEIIDMPMGVSYLNLTNVSVDIDSLSATVHFSVRNNGAHLYGMPFYCYLYEKNFLYDLRETGYVNLLPLDTLSCDFTFSDLTPGASYICYFLYYYDQAYTQVVRFDRSLSFRIPDTSVGIAATQQLPCKQRFDVYTASGIMVRRQTTSLEGLPKGVYIVKGQKVVVN